MRQSEELNELFAALATAQGEIEGAKKDSQNPHFKSKYADLASVVAVIREPMAKNGLAYVQTPKLSDRAVSVETMICHKSGQFIAETLEMPLAQTTAHGVGSAITYARRYALMAMVGVAPEDDDGNAATQPSAKPAGAARMITDEQFAIIDGLITKAKVKRDIFLQYFGISELGDLPETQFAPAKKLLEKKLAPPAETEDAQ